MNFNARLIYKSYSTCFHTFLPVYFYGMPNGRVYVLVAGKRIVNVENTVIEWTLARHCDFHYDYETDVIYDMQNREINVEEFFEFADKLEQNVNVIQTYGDFKSYNEAGQYFNVNAPKMLSVAKSVRAA
ncbi:MAG: hypothetical protein R2757_14390 [Draconibacterium sp.]